MKYIRDLQTTFNTEADRRGIDVEQLPSGEMHIYRQKKARHLDECGNIFDKAYFDQMEKRGFTKKSQQRSVKKTALDELVDNAAGNQATIDRQLRRLVRRQAVVESCEGGVLKMITDTDTVKCSDCGYVIAKDDACKDSSQELTVWYCHDCYAERQVDQQTGKLK